MVNSSTDRRGVKHLSVHPSGSNIKTIYAFLRFSDQRIHLEVVRRLNGRLHRGRYLHVRLNPLPTPEHRLNARHSPRVQFELNKLARKEQEWLTEKAMLQRQLRSSQDRVEYFVNVEAQLKAEITRLQVEPLNVDINARQTEIQQLEKSIAKWRTEVTKAAVIRRPALQSVIDAGERRLVQLQNELQEKQQLVFNLNNGVDELRGEVVTLQGLIGELTRERERLNERNQALEIENQELEAQLQTLRHQIIEQGDLLTNLRTENEELRRTQLQDAVSIVNCPVCLESSAERQMVALFCGHVL